MKTKPRKIRVFLDDIELTEAQLVLLWPVWKEIPPQSLDVPGYIELVEKVLADGGQGINRPKKDPLATKLCRVRCVLMAEKEKSITVEQPHTMRNGACGIFKFVPRSLCLGWKEILAHETGEFRGKKEIELTLAEWFAQQEKFVILEGPIGQ